MGYTTDFSGEFTFDKALDEKTLKLLQGLSTTRRVKRNVGPEFGVEGEFYIAGSGYAGQDRDSTVVNYNEPPRTQPGLWCQWAPSDDGLTLSWDGGEKFYNYVEWLKYLIDKVIAPAGYKLNGSVRWQGEEIGDRGKITVTDNKVTTMDLE